MQVIKARFRVSVCFYFVFSLVPALGDEIVSDFDHVAEREFWSSLYPFGGWTLYCGYRFDGERKIDGRDAVAVEHIFPASDMMQQLGCDSRMHCRESGNELYARMESDMHNLYPEWNAMITYRNGSRFGVITGEEWRFRDCDIEWQGGVLEPRPEARGNIARAMLYMHEQYGLKLEPETVQLMVSWNNEDPPSSQEIERNDRIEALQGRRNPYIDTPERAERLLSKHKDK
jgi:deoxyribonuclease-1